MASKLPYQIIEVANCHGGNFQYLMDLVKSFESFTKGYGIKFQPFRFDSIATENYSWYNVYKELYFDEKQWTSIIQAAASTKDVWIDLFDQYGIKILTENLQRVSGIKLQASVLYNYSLVENLAKLDLTDKNLVLNVAAHTVDEIDGLVNKFEGKFSGNICLEVGFQGYPTALVDSGIGKIAILKARFGKPVVFADHVAGNTDDAIWLPIYSALCGADMIEKHVLLDTYETKYDYFSSIPPEKYRRYIQSLTDYLSLQDQPFINQPEEEYLRKSMYIPFLSDDKPEGATISLTRDVSYKRSDILGLNANQVKQLIGGFHVLSHELSKGSPIRRADLRKATIAAIIACRLKSSRLKRKALLKIGSVSSIERCIASALNFTNVNHVVLATSTLDEDSELKDFTFLPSVIFHQGDPEDVIQRYLDIARKLRIDVVIRITGDMPYVDDEICQILLKSHFETGAEYTVAREAAVGTNLEIMNTAALERIKSHFPKANYSEYMTWYFQNNPGHFRLNFVDLPADLIRTYRMTLDYEEDLTMFNEIEKHFAEKKMPVYSLRDIFKYLDETPSVWKLNDHLTLTYKTDQTLIDTLNKVTKIIG